jgi:3-oxoacyl-[acyl-carrier protein] reductase
VAEPGASGGKLAGRVAIVTGAARGVGLAAVELFAAEGALVVAGDIRGDELQAHSARFGDRVAAVSTDVRTPEASVTLVRTALERFGGVDVVFNNAGVTTRRPLQETDDATWAATVAVNLTSAFYLSRAAVPVMARAGAGAIVNNASINALRGNVDLTAYAAAKGGLVAMTRALATELAPDGIRVNAICPGTIDTPMTDEYLSASANPEELTEQLVRKHPLGRLATADDVARAALFLASDDAAFITGVALPVDGGRHLL